MAIYSLTTEKVNKLLEQRIVKEKELNDLLSLTAKDIWNRDLDEASEAWQDILRNDILAAQADKNQKKKGTTSKLAKVARKRVSDAADGDYVAKKPKSTSTKANSTSKQTKITSFASKPAEEMQTTTFTSVNKVGSTSMAIPKKDEISKVGAMMEIDDDDEFELLVKGIRPEEKPTTIDLLSPQTAVKPRKTFTIPGVRKPSTATAPKPRAVQKPKAPKRKLESDDEDDSFAFMADDQPSASVGTSRRPARAAATKARAIVLTSDDVFDEMDEEDNFDEDDDKD